MYSSEHICYTTSKKLDGDISIMERSLIILKPDALQRGLTGEIIARFEKKGLKIIGCKMMRLDSAVLRAHYSHLTDKPFYQGLEDFMKSSPVITMAVEGFECVNSIRVILGATNPREAEAGTIRGDMSIGTGRNLVHASDSKENGIKEVERFFDENELFEYDKSEYIHVYEKHERE
jgi:nucleoside-diphosphate kinase